MGTCTIGIRIILFIFSVSKLPLSETGSNCQEDYCESTGRKSKKYCEIQLPVNTKIVSVEVKVDDSPHKCDSSKYGFIDTRIWVGGGCRGTFTVCYNSLLSTVLTSSTKRTTLESSTHHQQPSDVTLITGPTSQGEERESTTTKNLTELLPIRDDKNSSRILGGVLGGLLALVIVILIVIVLIRKLNFSTQKMPCIQTSVRTTDTGNQNVTLRQHQECTEYNNEDHYDVIADYREHHYYQDLEKEPDLNEETKPNSYMTLYDSSDQGRQSRECNVLNNATYEELPEINEHSKTFSNLNENKLYDCSKSQSDRKVEISRTLINTSCAPGQYASLDPEVTGYVKGKKSNLDKEGNYELANPLADVNVEISASDDQYMPSNDFSYDHAHDNRHKDTLAVNTYKRFGDNDYDSANHNIRIVNTDVNYQI